MAIRTRNLEQRGARIVGRQIATFTSPWSLLMKPALLYRIASGLLVLFAIGHTAGFRQVDPSWRAEGVLRALKNLRFDVQGFTRTYWDFYTGFGLFVTVFLAFAAILAWQLGGLPQNVLRAMPAVPWSLASSFVFVTFLSWRYFFVVPLAFSAGIALCLILAAWAAGRA
jgi:hypothetical protein